MEKRFGYIAVNKGFISEEQLAEAMLCQIKEDLCGLSHRLLGQILLANGNMTKAQVDIVLMAMNFPFGLCGKFIGIPTSRFSDIGTS